MLIFTITFLPIIYFIVCALKERKNSNNLLCFFQYGKPISGSQFLSTIAASNTSFSASIYLIIVYAYLYGIGVFFWIIIFWALTQISAGTLINKLQSQKYLNNFIENNGTMHEFLAHSFCSKEVRITAAIVSVISILGIVICEIKLGSQILSAIFIGNSLPDFLNNYALEFSYLTLFSIIIYASISGMRAVVKTDKIQLILIVLMLLSFWILITPFFPKIISSYSSFYNSNLLTLFFMPKGETTFDFIVFFVLSNLIFWAIWWPSASDQWHRVATTKSINTASNKYFGTYGLFTFGYFVFLTASFVLVGISIKILITGDGNSIEIFYNFITWLKLNYQNSFLGNLLIGFIGAGLISALISTLDTYLIVATQSTIIDIFESTKSNKTLMELSDE